MLSPSTRTQTNQLEKAKRAFSPTGNPKVAQYPYHQMPSEGELTATDTIGCQVGHKEAQVLVLPLPPQAVWPRANDFSV